MTEKSDEIRFGILDNAIDSIKQAIEMIAWQEDFRTPSQQLKRMKYLVIHMVSKASPGC